MVIVASVGGALLAYGGLDESFKASVALFWYRSRRIRYHLQIPASFSGTIHGYQTRYQTRNDNCNRVSRREPCLWKILIGSGCHVSTRVP